MHFLNTSSFHSIILFLLTFNLAQFHIQITFTINVKLWIDFEKILRKNKPDFYVKKIPSSFTKKRDLWNKIRVLHLLSFMQYKYITSDKLNTFQALIVFHIHDIFVFYESHTISVFCYHYKSNHICSKMLVH